MASGDFMRFRASGLNAVLSFGVVFRISRFDDGPAVARLSCWRIGASCNSAPAGDAGKLALLGAAPAATNTAQFACKIVRRQVGFMGRWI